MPYLEHVGAKLYYEKRGNWDSMHCPVVLLHGNGEDMSVFDKATEPLYSRFPFLAMDTRGHGRSDLLSGEFNFSYEQFADDVFALVTHLCINQFDIVGFSDGAICALMLACNPDTKSHVMRVVSVGANITPDGLKPAAIRQIAREKKIADSRGEKKKSALCELMLREPHISTDELARIYASVAVVSGSNDMVKPAHSEQIANSIIHAREIIIDGAGHMIPQDFPEKLREIILDELD
ncbi:MAG: alpha/beta hydrolase [Clostridia bacterium]|nr:alpha/beta hydrolase [Clostridia bacterium]